MTGAAGQIAYSLLYSIGNGSVFGKDQVGPVYKLRHCRMLCVATNDEQIELAAPTLQ